MHASNLSHRRSLAVWFLVFFAPTIYFVLIFLGKKFHFGPNKPGIYAQIVGSLIYFIPAFALLTCWCLVLLSSMTVGRKARWMLFTLLAMLLQIVSLLVGVLFTNGFDGIQ